jgi:hypothetical protein
MNTTKRAIACLLLATAVTSSACSKKGDLTMRDPDIPVNGTPLSWRSPRLISVQKEWYKLRDSFGTHTMKAEYEKNAKILDEFLEKRLSARDLRELARSCGEVPLRDQDREPFVKSLLDHMLMAFVDSGDRDSLVTLLSIRCPNRVGWQVDIEWFLVVFPEKKRTIKDPILVLGDAYAQCKIPEIRRDIASVVRRGFSTMRIPNLNSKREEDADYVSKAMKWYLEHKDELVPNLEYTQNEGMDRNPYSIPLFNWKSAPRKQ